VTLRIPPPALRAPSAPAPAALGRALQLARAGYGVTLLLQPGSAIRLATGRPPSRGACRVARLLGARHLAQATLTALAPRPGMFAAGTAADALHAASMLMLAVVDRTARRTALTDAMAEAAFAAAGLAAAAAHGGGTPAQPAGTGLPPVPTGSSRACLS
jgi:hypothetical protein